MNNCKPYFSVVIPLYNRENLVVETLQTIAQQTFKDFEVIIVNDGSTDNSAEIARQALIDFELTGIVLDIKNSGHGAARDHGISKSKGEYLAPIDSDDLWLPDFLMNMHKAISSIGEEAKSRVFFSDFNLFFENDKQEENKFASLIHFQNLDTFEVVPNVFDIKSDMFEYLLIEQPIFWGGVAFSRHIYNVNGAIGKHIPGRSGSPVEWEFYLRCAYNGFKGTYVKSMNTKIRRHSGNMSSALTTQLEGELEILHLLNKILNLSSLQMVLVNQQINERTFNCGYQYFDQENFIKARKLFRQTRGKKYFIKSTYYILLTYLPLFLFKALRR